MITATIGGVFAAKKFASSTVGQRVLSENMQNIDKYVDFDGTVNILLLGVDGGGMRSDTIMLASLSGAEKKVSVLSIPRDTRISIGNGNHVKINSAIGIGAQEVRKGRYSEAEDYTIKKVKELTGLPVHFFMTIDFDGFQEVIDILGGVDFNIPFHMKYDDPLQNLHIDLPKGPRHLNGKEAHDFVRFRQGNPGYPGYVTGDLGRIEAQQEFLKALVKQKLKPEYLLKATELFEAAGKYMKTNYTVQDLLRHLGAIEGLSADNVKMFQMPGTPQTINGASYVLVNQSALNKLIEDEF